MIMRTQNLNPDPSPARRGPIPNSPITSFGGARPIKTRVIGYENSLSATATGNLKPKPSAPVDTTGFRLPANEWKTITLNLPQDIETALLARQYKPAAETPNEKALQAVGQELRMENYPVILKLYSSGAPRLFIGEKVQVGLKWEIYAYIEDEQPASYEEHEYYLDEVCLEIFVCGVRVESTLCMENFYAKMRELKAMNPGLFNK
jgi:hypothetical protein